MTQRENELQDEIWVTDIFWEPAVAFSQFWCELYDTDDKAAFALIEAIRDGKAVPAEAFPSEMWSKPSKQAKKKFPHMFRAGGFDVVSGEMAEVLRRHNIGNTQMFPSTLLKRDRKTPHDGEFYFLNIRETKYGFNPDASPKFGASSNPAKRKGSIPLGLSDGDIAVDEHVLVGPDLWLDPSLFRSYFVKGALARELFDRKMIPSNRVIDKADIARCVVSVL